MNNLNNILSGLFDTNKKINNRVSTHIDNSLIHVPSGGVSGQILQVNENGVPSWVSVNNESDNEVNKISVSGMPADPDVNYNQEYELVDSTDGLIWQGLTQSEYYKECIRFGEHPGNGQTCWIFSDDTRFERFFIYSNNQDPLSIIGDQTVYDASNTAFNVKITQIGNLTLDNVNNILQNHIDNTNIHVTQTDKNNWDSKIGIPSGGSNGQVLTTDGSGNYSWSTIEAGSDITVDSILSNTSENPVQNKVISQAFETIISVNNDQTSAINNHTMNNSIHVTSDEKNTWNAKANSSDIDALSNRIAALENPPIEYPNSITVTCSDSSLTGKIDGEYTKESYEYDEHPVYRKSGGSHMYVFYVYSPYPDTKRWHIVEDIMQSGINTAISNGFYYYYSQNDNLEGEYISTGTSASGTATITGDSNGGSSVEITIDSELSNTSENPVQNKVITLEIEEIKSVLSGVNTQLNTLISETNEGAI